MTTYRMEVTDLGELAKAFEKLASEWEHIAEYAMKNALVVTGYCDRVWQRTPKSDRARYAMRYRGVAPKKIDRGQPNDPGSWAVEMGDWEGQMMKGVEGTTARDARERSIARLNEYGHTRLANSILPYGEEGGSRNLAVRRRQGTVELVLSSSVPYAARMHETRKPGEGEYWTPGKDSGWSASRTGNKFLERPYLELQDRIIKEFAYGVDKRLRNMGLMP